MTGNCYLGIDGGGTKTAAVLLDENAREIARAVGGSSNVHSAGLAVAEASLREAIGGVLSAAGLRAADIRADVTAVGLGLAGAGRPEDRQTARDLLARIADFHHVVITHDAEAALVGGVGRRHGVVLVAGTGAMAYGVNARGESRRADGWGYLLGDEGSAHWIGLAGLRAVVRACDGRGPATALADTLLLHLGLPDADALVTWAYADDSGVPALAALAPLVSQVARDGDAVALGILREAGQHLGETVCAVVRGLGMGDETFEAVLMGGLLHARDLVRETVVAALSEVAPRARVIEPRYDAAVGAALLAGAGNRESGIGKRGIREAGRGEQEGDEVEELLGGVPVTEARNPQTAAIDTLSSLEIVRLINEEDAKVARAVRRELPQIARAVDVIVERLQHPLLGRLFYFGAGTSGRLGVLDASEMPPTFSVPPELVQGFIAGGDAALRRSAEAAEDEPQMGAKVVREVGVSEFDVVVGITASGGAPWVLGAVAEAQRRGAATVGLTCNPDSPLARQVEVAIAPVVGPEVIAGSSRMKAGTAQKMVLNMLSTATMIRLGKVYGNLMVDVRPTNAKLRRRAVRILQEAVGADEDSARRALEATGYEVKPALVMLLVGVDVDEARQRLSDADGFVRQAVGAGQ